MDRTARTTPQRTPLKAAAQPEELFVEAPSLRSVHEHLIGSSLSAVKNVDYHDAVPIIDALYRFAAACIADLERRRRSTGFSITFTGHWGPGGALVITTETKFTLGDHVGGR